MASMMDHGSGLGKEWAKGGEAIVRRLQTYWCFNELADLLQWRF